MLKYWKKTVREALAHAQGEVVVLLEKLPPAKRLERLEARLATIKGPVTFAGWSVPERNLHIPACEFARLSMRLRGAEAFSRFRVFMDRFGVEGMAYRSGRDIVERRLLCCGAATMVILGPVVDTRRRAAVLAQRDKVR